MKPILQRRSWELESTTAPPPHRLPLARAPIPPQSTAPPPCIKKRGRKKKKKARTPPNPPPFSPPTLPTAFASAQPAPWARLLLHEPVPGLLPYRLRLLPVLRILRLKPTRQRRRGCCSKRCPNTNSHLAGFRVAMNQNKNFKRALATIFRTFGEGGIGRPNIKANGPLGWQNARNANDRRLRGHSIRQVK